MALIRCVECGGDVSDKASACPKCGAPVDATAPAAPDIVGYVDGAFVGTRAQLIELAKSAIGRRNYRLDAADVATGTITFTTGVTMGSWSGVSGTISLQEVAPYRFNATGQAKQNVKGGQVLALDIGGEAAGKIRAIVDDMRSIAQAGSVENAPPPSSACALVLVALVGLSGAGTWGLVELGSYVLGS